ncbi:DUF4145 domain-containing protein [Rhodococcus erythropolis]|nr:DUF4145 domain-containing protein [Rhodococcus erythropolis]
MNFMAAETIQTDPDDAQDDGRNPDTLPTSGDPSGVCPRCGKTAHFDLLGTLPLLRNPNGDPPLERVAALQCQGCRKGTAVIEVKPQGSALYSPERQGVHWWPITGAVIDISDVPLNLSSAFQEGVRCVSVEAPHAAVAMFRNALAQIVQDKGSEAAKKKSTLNDAVKQMVDDRTLHDGFKDWAEHVRKVGNAGAHQETWEAIPLVQAQELQELVSHLIESLYVQPAKLSRAIAAKKRPKP